LACDGIWDCLSNEECVQSLDKKLKAISATDPISKPVEKLLEEILAPNTDDGIGTDNMTAILIKFKNGSVGSE
jgi:serine/threonine protein phosphatase PrpC